MPSAGISGSLSFFIQTLEQAKLRIRSLVRPREYQNLTRLYLLEPYRRDRIPVIFIHGLKSTPATWLGAVTMLFHDPVLRVKYQPLLYFYPSGSPLLLSIYELRNRLRAFVDQCGGNPLSRQMTNMVLVGHSLGGIISSAQIRNANEPLTDAVFDNRATQLNLTKQERRALSPLFTLQANPCISRVIFVCTPHRGSDRVGNWIDKLSAALVRHERTVICEDLEIYSREDPFCPDLQKIRGLDDLPNGIQALRAGSPLLDALVKMPIRTGIRYHSIIGHRKQGGTLDKISDGWVPYWSAHLDGADSELLVPSAHAATEHPQTLSEIRRILLLHAAEFEPDWL
ncbi:MAG: esterase/lipase family protein [Gammaproteobacteria bacterium]